MAIRLTCRHSLGLLWTAALLTATVMAGCNRGEPGKPDKAPENVALTQVKIVVDPRLKQSFQDATLQEPPEGELKPPDQTAAGKSIGRIYEEIAGPGGLWDKIAFNT